MTAPALWSQSDADFPPLLANIPSAPHALYTLGDRTSLEGKCVAIVGTRHPTPYGERITTRLVHALVDAGICIVSGMAKGIDGVAHRAALTARGRTAAILGTAIDAPYPRTHAALYDAIVADGVVLSEYAPGTPMFQGCFPRRNRIIAGLAPVTVVVEAGEKSGALITANYAADYGRTVAAVPGPVDSPQSQGSNQLIRDGANVILDPQDLLTLLGLSQTAPTTHESADAPAKTQAATPTKSRSQPQSNDAPPSDMTAAQHAIWNAIAPGRDVDAILAITGLSASEGAVAITMLEMRGVITCLLNGELQKR